MHLNLVLLTDRLTPNCIKHYGLNGELGGKIKSQCFFDEKNKVTDITWAGVILTKGMPYWNELKGVLNWALTKGYDDIKNEKQSEASCIKSMHELAEKYG